MTLIPDHLRTIMKNNAHNRPAACRNRAAACIALLRMAVAKLPS